MIMFVSVFRMPFVKGALLQTIDRVAPQLLNNVLWLLTSPYPSNHLYRDHDDLNRFDTYTYVTPIM